MGQIAMNRLDILPEYIRKKSVGHDDIVILPYKEALEALDIFFKAGFGFTGWEGVNLYPDGTKSFSLRYMGARIESADYKTWESYCKRGYEFMKKTIQDEYADWLKSDESSKYQLYFSIGAVDENRVKELTKETKEANKWFKEQYEKDKKKLI